MKDLLYLLDPKHSGFPVSVAGRISSMTQERARQYCRIWAVRDTIGWKSLDNARWPCMITQWEVVSNLRTPLGTLVQSKKIHKRIKGCLPCLSPLREVPNWCYCGDPTGLIQCRLLFHTFLLQMGKAYELELTCLNAKLFNVFDRFIFVILFIIYWSVNAKVCKFVYVMYKNSINN